MVTLAYMEGWTDGRTGVMTSDWRQKVLHTSKPILQVINFVFLERRFLGWVVMLCSYRRSLLFVSSCCLFGRIAFFVSSCRCVVVSLCRRVVRFVVLLSSCHRVDNFAVFFNSSTAA